MDAGEDVEKREHLHTAGTVWTRFKKKKERKIKEIPIILLQGKNRREIVKLKKYLQCHFC